MTYKENEREGVFPFANLNQIGFHIHRTTTFSIKNWNKKVQNAITDANLKPVNHNLQKRLVTVKSIDRVDKPPIVCVFRAYLKLYQSVISLHCLKLKINTAVIIEWRTKKISTIW